MKQKLTKQKDFINEIQFLIEDEIRSFSNMKELEIYSPYTVIMWELTRMSEKCTTLNKIIDVLKKNIEK